MYAEVKTLPEAVRNALESVGYARKDIRVEVRETVTLSSSGGDGYRAFVTLVNLTTGQYATMWGSWGGANMFNPGNAVDNDDRAYPLPDNAVAITGSIGGGKPVYASLYVNTNAVNRYLPAPSAELSEVQREALYAHRLKSGYRKDHMRRHGVTPDVVDGLVSAGLLSRNRAGAVQITTAGKNAIS